MAWWLWVLDAVGVLLLLVVLSGLFLVLRRRVLERKGGTFELSVRDPDAPVGQGWVLGLGRYRAESLEWFRIFSPLPGPRETWRRDELALVGQREPAGTERHALYADHVVVRCDTVAGEVELALDPSSLTGLSSWLESGPPGSRGAGMGG